MSMAQIDINIRLGMWIVILILANAVYSLWKKESWNVFLVRTLCFVGMSALIWFMP
jgi:hypothetical protein